jgi:hypothetical protein
VDLGLSAMATRVCIVGVAESDCGSVPDKSALQLHQQAARAALRLPDAQPRRCFGELLLDEGQAPS